MPCIPALLHRPTAAALSLGAFLFPAWLLSVVVELPEVTVAPAPDRPVATLHASLGGPSGAPSVEAPEAPVDDATPAEPVPSPAPALADAQESPDAPPAAEATAPQPLPTRTSGRVRPVADPDRRARIRARVARSKALAGARGDGEEALVADAPPKKKRKQRACVEGDNPDIDQVGAGSFRVSRDLVDYYTDDLREAARLASVAWHKGDDGKVDGFRIRHIRCGSVLHEAGLRNGDVIHKVNGKPVRNIPQALAAYRKLRKKRKLWLDVTREGEGVDLRYRLS